MNKLLRCFSATLALVCWACAPSPDTGATPGSGGETDGSSIQDPDGADLDPSTVAPADPVPEAGPDPSETDAGGGAPSKTDAGGGAPSKTDAGGGAPSEADAGGGAPSKTDAGGGAPGMAGDASVQPDAGPSLDGGSDPDGSAMDSGEDAAVAAMDSGDDADVPAVDGGDDADVPAPDAGPDAAATDPDFVCEVMYRAGHGDLFASYADGLLELSLRSHLVYPSPGGLEPLHDPAQVCIVVPASSRQRVIDQGGRPADGFGFEPIGVGAGEPFWFLSNSNLGAEQPFWGVATEGIEVAELRSDVRFVFLEVDGPADAQLAVYRIAGIQPAFLVSTADPDAAQGGEQQIVMPAGEHDHHLWSFTQPGHYAVSVQARALDASGQSIASAVQTYHFLVEE